MTNVVNLVTNPLDDLGKEAFSAWGEAESIRIQMGKDHDTWVEKILDKLAPILKQGRDELKSNNDFSSWLKKNKLNLIGDHERGILIKLANNLPLAKEIYSKSESCSIQEVYRLQIKNKNLEDKFIIKEILLARPASVSNTSSKISESITPTQAQPISKAVYLSSDDLKQAIINNPNLTDRKISILLFGNEHEHNRIWRERQKLNPILKSNNLPTKTSQKSILPTLSQQLAKRPPPFENKTSDELLVLPDQYHTQHPDHPPGVTYGQASKMENGRTQILPKEEHLKQKVSDKFWDFNTQILNFLKAAPPLSDLDNLHPKSKDETIYFLEKNMKTLQEQIDLYLDKIKEIKKSKFVIVASGENHVS